MSSKRFKLGKYDIVAQPVAGSSHMLRYTVLLDGKRLGALFSVPCESDCSFLESPPPVPPLKIFSVTYRPAVRRKARCARKRRISTTTSRCRGRSRDSATRRMTAAQPYEGREDERNEHGVYCGIPRA